MGGSKLTLIVDGNWLLMSRLSVMYNRFSRSEELVKELNLLMMKSLSIILKTFPAIDNVIFVADGGSWRSGVSPTDYLKKDGIEYKGNRTKDPNIDWDLIFKKGFRVLMDELKNSGITVCREMMIEGDDWCWWWSRKLNAEGTNVIIWSRDKDLSQLTTKDKNGYFTVCWDKDSGLTCKDVNDEDMDFFFNPTFSENEVLFNEIERKSVKVNRINPSDIILDKIIRGDLGDNIIPIIYKESKTGKDRKYRVSPKELPVGLDIMNENDIRTFIHYIVNSKSYKGKVNKSEDDIYEHFLYNRKMVWLDKSSYPSEVLNILENYSTYEKNKEITEVLQRMEAKKQMVDEVLDEI